MKSWSFTQWIIAIIVICGAIAIMYIATDAMGVHIPAWAISIGWVVIIVVVAIIAIGVLASVGSSWFGGGGPPSTP